MHTIYTMKSKILLSLLLARSQLHPDRILTFDCSRRGQPSFDMTRRHRLAAPRSEAGVAMEGVSFRDVEAKSAS